MVGELEPSDLVAVFPDVSRYALPPVALRILGVGEHERFSAHELSQAIASDTSLTGHVLGLANSAFFGFPRRIGTVRDAVVLLGFQAVRSAGLAACLAEALPSPSEHVLDRRAVWRFSVIVGLLTEVLARAEDSHHDSAFVGGVLQGVGRLVIADQRPADFSRAVATAQREGIPVAEAERRLLGFSDADAGSALVSAWGLPEGLVAAAGAVEPGAGRASLAALVNEARAYALAQGESDGADSRLVPSPLWATHRVAAALEESGGWRRILDRATVFLDHAGVA